MKIYEVTDGIQGQIKRSNANEVEVEDPKKPGVVTKIDLKKLQEGLTKEQVQYIFGTALIQDPFRDSRWDYFNSVRVGEKVITENKLTIYFDDNGLVESWIVEESTPEIN